MADWKTYRNDKNGFLFKYPKDWEIRDLTNISKGAGNIFTVQRLELKSPDYDFRYSGGDWGYSWVESGMYINFVVSKNTWETLEQIKKEKSSQGKTLLKTDISGNSLLYEERVNDKIYSAEFYLVRNLKGEPKPVVFNITLEADPDKQDYYRDLFDKFLQTLEFDSSQLTHDVNVSKEEAFEKVINLPEVENFLTNITQGRVALVNQDYKDPNSWTVHVYESLPTHNATFNWYYVNKETGEITKMITR